MQNLRRAVRNAGFGWGLVLAGCTGELSEPLEPMPQGRTEVPTATPGAPLAAPNQPKPAVQAGPCPLPAARLWKLTPDQLARTFGTLIPGSTGVAEALTATISIGDDSFSNAAGRLDMSATHVDALMSLVDSVATQAMRNRARLEPCLGTSPIDAACVQRFVEGFGGRAFRRPLTTDEVGRYVQTFTKGSAVRGAETALVDLVRALLLSPHTLYRTELGATNVAGAAVVLTPFERASALSYFLTDGPPDGELMAAARDGHLSTPAQLVAHARRLLKTPTGGTGLIRLFTERFGWDEVTARTKDSKTFPTWTTSLAADMAQETTRFVEEVLWRDDGRLLTLLTAPYSVVTPALARHYGASPGAGTGFAKLMLPAGQRAGLLTQASLLASLAHADETDIVQRGKFVRERLLCQPVPPPPPSVNAVPPRPDGLLTGRERLAQHSQDPTCQGCHHLLDPLGFAFESYDAIGRHRTTDAGKPVDVRGTIEAVAGGPRPFTGTLALGKLLAELPESRRCLLQTLDRYAYGGTDAGTACRVARLTSAFDAADGHLLEAVIAIVASDEFVTRSR